MKQGKGGFQLDGERVSADFRNIQFVDSVNGEQSSVSAIAAGSLGSDVPIRAELRLDRISAATLGRLANLQNTKIDGELLAHAVLQCTADRVSRPDAWEGDAVFQAKSIHVDDQAFADCEACCQIANGAVSLNRLRGFLAGGELTGNGTCKLVSPFSCRGNTSLTGASIGQIASLAGSSHEIRVDGSLDISLSADGEIATNRWQARGHMTGTELRFGGRPFADTRLDFLASPDVIVAKTPPNGFLGGGLELTAKGLAGAHGEVLAPAAQTCPSLSGRLVDIPLPAIAQIAELKERIEGTVSCEFAAHSLNGLAKLNAVAVVDSPGVAIRGVSFKQIHADVTLRDGQADTHLNALGFGGQFDVRANADVVQLSKLRVEEPPKISALPVNVLAIVSDVKLQELWPVFGLEKQLRPLRGNLTASLERGDAEREQGTIAVGDLKLRDFRWDNVRWSNQLQAGVVLGEKFVELRQFAGPFAGGQVERARQGVA